MTKRHTTRDGWWEFIPTLRNREDFKTGGALRGTRGVEYLPRSSQLPSEYGKGALESVYAVWSYETPIAWANPDGTWTVPDVKYSVTTSRHQSKIRTAVDNIDSTYSRANPPWGSHGA